MTSKNNPKSRDKDIVVQDLRNETLIYDLTDNKAWCLNPTSALIWNLCDGSKTVSQISEELGKKLKMPASEDLVWMAIDQLKKENLLVNGEELHSKFDDLSRRDVIKKVGLATMIALPVIAGITAPQAIYAASCAGYPITENQVCSQSCQCQGRPAGGGTFAPSSCCQVQAGGQFFCRESAAGCLPGTIKNP